MYQLNKNTMVHILVGRVSYRIFLGGKTVGMTLQNFVVKIATIVATFVHAIV